MIWIKSFPLLIILTLFISGFTMPLIKDKKWLRKISFISMSFSSLLATIHLSYVLSQGGYIYRIGHWDAPWGIAFKIGEIEAILGCLFPFVTTLVLWYGLFTIHKEIKENRLSFYYLLMNLLIGALLGIVFTDDLFNAFVFIEISTLASCGIIVIKDKKENIKATLKYLILSTLGSGLFLLGLAFLYSITGHLNMEFMHDALVQGVKGYPHILLISLALFTVGLGVKSAMFPLHIWLPDAHANAPSTSSAVLSAIVLKAFVYLLIKILFRVFGLDLIRDLPIFDFILILGSLGMILGSILAMRQKEIKRVIAYSSVAQMGYIFYGIGLGSKLGLSIAIYHIIGHAITKATLFLSVGSMIEQTGVKNLKELRGVGKEMPVTLGIFTIGALSMVGIPVLPGFISKWYFALASIEAEKFLYLGVILMSSILNALYYLPIVINGYFGEENLAGKVYMSKNKPIKELLPVIILTLGIIMVGLGSRSLLDIIQRGLN